jgi:hypothetical protein
MLLLKACRAVHRTPCGGALFKARLEVAELLREKGGELKQSGQE